MRLRPLVAEFVGTFTLIFVGVGAIAATTADKRGPDLLAVALAHGLAIGVMVGATAAVSGGHLNPAVTLGALVAGRIGIVGAVGYWVAQFLGGIAGALMIAVTVPASQLKAAGYGIPAPGQGVGQLEAVVLELILTFFLMFVIYGTAMRGTGSAVAGLFIGLTITLDILVGGPLTGAAMNPARFVGPALVNLSQLQFTWIYFVGPAAGAIAAAALWRFVLEEGRRARAASAR
ncbi:MAG TPA: aquaporin [Candidatus Dormibacteraeota bacterium]|nr:aquaporin [Candidatus Dormibacteraeota bacterium]